MKRYIQLASVGLMGLALQTNAAVMTVDQIIYQGVPGGDPSALSGTVNMTLSGNTLTVVLRNTSTASGVQGSFNLLTGVGFNLPTGVTIGSGSAAVAAGSGVNWSTATSGVNVSQEWGYDNNPVSRGPFEGVTTLDVNTAVSSMESSTDTKFQPGMLLSPDTLNGPEFGLLSANVPTSDAGGLNAIRDSITITLNLSGTVNSTLLSFIEANPVVLSFASPDRVPEGGSTAILLGLALLGFGGLRRKLQK